MMPASRARPLDATRRPALTTEALINDVFRGRHFGAIFGCFQIAGALGGATGPWVAGRVFDVTGSYAPAFTAAVVAAGVAMAALWGTRRGTRRPSGVMMRGPSRKSTEP